MGRRSLRFALLVLSGGLVVASQSPIQAGQVSQGGPGAQVKKAYKTPRTPWGDPDLQGNYTNLYEAGTPLERPDEFAGRKLPEITGAELRAAKKAIQDNTIQRFETPFDAPSNWWQDAFRLGNSAQAWMITDPDDGHIPARTAEGQARQQNARQTIYAGGSNSWETAVCTIAASRAVSRRPACRPSTATRRESCRARGSSPSSTR